MGTHAAFGFILGTGRCGSTLVHDLVARHPDVGFLSNVDDRLRRPLFWGRWNNPLYRRVPLSLTQKGRPRFAPSEGYRILGARVSPMLVAPCRDLVAADAAPWIAERFAGFFRRVAAAQGRPLFLHKFTGWPRAGFIEAALPGCRFIHIVRDGRAVAGSLVRMPWWDGFGGPERWSFGPLSDADRAVWEAAGRSFAVLAGLEWKILMQAFEAARGAVLGERWLELRYEDILSDPRGGFERILDFLGLPWTRSFERHFRRYPFRSDRVEAYRRDLTSAELRALDACLGERLARLGYPVPMASVTGVSA